jgi:hypothetical protein
LPISCTLDHGRKLVLVSAEGEMTLPDLETVFDKVVVEGGMSYRKLVDTSRATSRLSDDEVLTLGARISAYRAFEPRGPVPIVAGPDSLDDARRFIKATGAHPHRPAKEAGPYLVDGPAGRAHCATGAWFVINVCANPEATPCRIAIFEPVSFSRRSMRSARTRRSPSSATWSWSSISTG